LQREDVLLEIAKKARARAELEKIEIHPVPNKLLVPFLEKASLEDADKEMQDRWAALLLSAAKDYQSRHLTFVDILSRLSSNELKFLEEIAFSYKAFPDTSYPGGHVEENGKAIQSNAWMLELGPRLNSAKPLALNPRDVVQKFIEAVGLTYGRIMHASARYDDGGSAFVYSDFGARGTPGFSSVEILEREELMRIDRLKFRGLDIGWCQLTYLGVQFVCDCSPRAAEMAARRPKPIVLGQPPQPKPNAP
jgi:hypothetical protein